MPIPKFERIYNEAIDLLVSGSYREAGTEFSTIIRECILNHPVDSKVSFQVDLEMIPCETDEYEQTDDESEWCVYRKLAFVQFSDTCSESANDGMLDEVVVSLLYNFALSQHFLCLQTPAKRQAKLKCVLKLYEAALFAAEGLQFSTFENFFASAIINNMIHIHSYFYDDENAANCVESLKYCVFGSIQWDDPIDATVEFSSNLVIFAQKECRRAPAA